MATKSVIESKSEDMPFVIMKTYYKHGDTDVKICKTREDFLKEAKEHIEELSENEKDYELEIDHELKWVRKLIEDSKRIMIEEQGGYGWTAVVCGKKVWM